MNVLECIAIVKRYGNRTVLSDISVRITSGECFCIAGNNGAGKSTLLKILCGLLRPDAGTVHASVDEHTTVSVLTNYHVNKLTHFGLVAPYLNMYDEFSPLELLVLQRKLHAEEVDDMRMEATLERLGLADRMHETVRTLSSGLRQRVVLALAVHREPVFLMLDEPTITLDATGVSIVHAEVVRQQQRGGIVVIATNDESEKQLCTRILELENSRSRETA